MGRIGVGAAVHAEWTKLRTVRSTGWLVVAAVASTVTVGAAAADSVTIVACPTPDGCLVDTTKLTLTGVWVGQAAVVVLAVLAVTNEYGTRMIQTTLAATPRRGIVLTTKAAVVTATVLAAGTLGVLGSLAAGWLVLRGNGFTTAGDHPLPSLTGEPALRAAAGTVLYLCLVALLSVGVGAVVRDTAGAITAVLTLLYVFPVVTQFVTDPRWHERLERVAPATAGLAVQATIELEKLPIGPWAGLGVLAAYAGGAMLLGAIVFTVRDA